MTSNQSPRLAVRRLVITAGTHLAYDQEFHPGVNIIHGDNAHGKSTVADSIFYVLGGDLREWSEASARCDSVIAEVDIRGRIYTLARKIEPDSETGMYISDGAMKDIGEAFGAARYYPYRRSSQRESFSQVLFSLLGFPEQVTEEETNITMHQVMRLLYGDQITGADRIFRSERWDTEATRRGVSELILGLDDLEIHGLRLKRRSLDKEFDSLQGEIKALHVFLGQVGAEVTPIELYARREEVEKKLESLWAALSDLSSKEQEGESEVLTQLRERLGIERGARRRRQDRLEALLYEVADSQAFVTALQSKLTALEESGAVRNYLGTLAFEYCPACLTPISDDGGSASCHLCKEALVTDQKRLQLLRVREEIVFQLRESTHIIEDKEKEIAAIKQDLAQTEVRIEELERQLKAEERSTDRAAEVGELYRELGYWQRQREELAKQEEVASVLQEKYKHKEDINNQLSLVRSRIETLEKKREARKDQLNKRIRDTVLYLLHRDLPLEDSFRQAEDFEFDFAKDRIRVDGMRRLSASSTVYLKNAFRVALFWVSLIDSEMLWPRFLILDNVEDKGMRPERSHNFQKVVVEGTAQFDVPCQLIMTTSMPAPEFKESGYSIGPYYADGNKALQLAR